MKSSAARGRDFEDEVAVFLRSAGFDVTSDAKAAKPRQTDLFARGDKFDLLVEAKNQKRNVGINDIDALRSRLSRITPDIVGALFTTSRLTRGAIEEIEKDRTRLVLAVDGQEIERLRSGTHNLRTLIDRKREELRVHGRAWFGTEIRSEFVDVKLPHSNAEFRIGGATDSLFETRSKFGGPFFALEIPDSGWTSVVGEGARLSIHLELNSTKDLRNIIGYLHHNFGLTSTGAFSIQQSGSCWYGVGAENFLRSAEQWRERYKRSLSKTFHHSEELIYFDQFRDGWIELSSQQRNDWERPQSFLHHSELVIQLSGVPVDGALFVRLCRYTNNDWATFNYIGERWTSRVRLKTPILLDVVGTIVREFATEPGSVGERTVVGLIARNPFWRRKSLPRELMKLDVAPPHGLKKSELIVCSLRDWHDDGDVVDRYALQGIELTVGGVGNVIRPFGTWSKMLKRVRDSPQR